jgi:hypothetical protein
MAVSEIELTRLQARDEKRRVILDLSAYLKKRGGVAFVNDARHQIGLNDTLDARRFCHWAANVLMLDRVRTRCGEQYRVQAAGFTTKKPND